MFQRFASTAFVAGTLLSALMPAVGLARDHDGDEGRRSSSERSARGSGGRYSGGRNFVSPRESEGRRGYSSRPNDSHRGYIAPRSYARPAYGGYYSGSLSLGYSVPYGYTYDPGYAYDP